MALLLLWLLLIVAVAPSGALGWCSGEKLPAPCASSGSAMGGHPWCDVTKSNDARATALLANLSLEETAIMLLGKYFGPEAPIGSVTGPIERLNYPQVHWWHEALHGVYWPGSGLATSWPQVIGVAASFNRTLFRALGELTGNEGRAKCGVQSDYWTPNLNVFREPLWGRGQETAGEDPILISEYAASFITGLQGRDERYVRLAATPKHFAGYDGPEDNPSRLTFDAIITAQDLHDTYLPAFQSAVQRGRARGLMCSYNALNGVPMCANEKLLNGLARDRWGFTGYVVTDCLAFDAIVTDHRFAPSLNATIPLAYGCVAI